MFDGAREAAWNMAVDEALLEAASSDHAATLRFYGWSAPTLSLGYFQSLDDRGLHAGSAGLPVVRRSSGGGALVHHHELTYSLALPAGADAARDSLGLYCLVHRALVDAVGDLGGDSIRMLLCGPAGGASAEPGIRIPGSNEPQSIAQGRTGGPFLCFQRRSPGDVLVRPRPMDEASPVADGLHKVCGSAQRRRRGPGGAALLQHGGVLLTRSDRAPELPGLTDLGVLPDRGAQSAGSHGEQLPARALAEAWAERIARRIGLVLEPISAQPGWPESVQHAAQRLVSERFGDAAWLGRR